MQKLTLHTVTDLFNLNHVEFYYNVGEPLFLHDLIVVVLAILPIDSRRYGTPQMLAIFDEQRKIDYQIEIEAAVAAAQAKTGIIPHAAARQIVRASRKKKITARRIAILESKSDHDTAALVQALGEQCPKSARPWIHYGLTSNDLVDTSNSMQMRDALDIIIPKMLRLSAILGRRAKQYRNLPAVGRTHGQHASIISFGLKFANWASEITHHIIRIEESKKRILLCKTLGVVGTGSLMGLRAVRVQRAVSLQLGLYPVEVATQVIPRERYAEYVFNLSLLGATLEKIAVEIRNLQRTEIREIAEHFGKTQMGSSAVPVKRNPTKSERVSSLSRLLRNQLGTTFENIALWHERDLSNSANERFILPITAILIDEMLVTMINVLDRLYVDTKQITKNLYLTRGQIFSEFVLEALICKGIPRMIAYRDVQRVAFAANKSGIDFADAVSSDPVLSSKLCPAEIAAIFVPKRHLGAAPSIIDTVCRSVERLAARY